MRIGCGSFELIRGRQSRHGALADRRDGSNRFPEPLTTMRLG